VSSYTTLAKCPRNDSVYLNVSGPHRHLPALVIYAVVICCLFFSTFAIALVELRPAPSVSDSRTYGRGRTFRFTAFAVLCVIKGRISKCKPGSKFLSSKKLLNLLCYFSQNLNLSGKTTILSSSTNLSCFARTTELVWSHLRIQIK
jgi:hypothetical protein